MNPLNDEPDFALYVQTIACSAPEAHLEALRTWRRGIGQPMDLETYGRLHAVIRDEEAAEHARVAEPSLLRGGGGRA